MSESRIRVMGEQLANQIAAGEVVERPASVVKELVENSIDAEAGRIEVAIEDGGRQLLQVTDDGIGMTREEALLALKRHATSKIRSVEDLRSIGTLGFRGEALPSIVSVCRFEMETRTADAMEGVRVTAAGSDDIRVEDAGVPRGTRISVADLFFNVPARRKFLRTKATESGRVSAAMTRFALGYPHIHFRLTNGGRKVLDAAPERRLQDRVFSVLGRKVASRLYPASIALDVEVEGLVSDPALHRVNAEGMYTFVNGRFIRDRLVQHAITSAYGSLLDRGRYPYVVLFIRVPPSDLDVNVHPTKAEVRFVRSGQVHEAIVRAVKMTLAEAPWLESEGPARYTPAAPSRLHELRLTRAAPADADIVAEGPATYFGESAPSAGALLRALEVAPSAAPASAAPAPPEPTAPNSGFFARMRYVGQVNRMFLLCETAGALHVIDQHAAHERVTYERLRAGYQGAAVPMQTLLFPIQIEVAPEEVQAIEDHGEALGQMGFDVAAFGERTIALRGVPAVLVQADHTTLVRDVLAELRETGQSRAFEERLDAVAARLACHGSVRGGDEMTPQEVRELLRQLDAVDFRANCPHGRPVVVTHPFERVARWFDRT